MIIRFEEGHEVLMRQALADFDQSGGQLPSAVDPRWLTLGNVRTDVPNIDFDRRVSWWHIAHMVWRGIGCTYAEHHAHAMRCRRQLVAEAYRDMLAAIRQGFVAGCNSENSWQERALAFGSMLHTLQDSYCPAHAERLSLSDPTSPLIDMFTYPSRQHPITTKRDAVWQDMAKTAFTPAAASAIQATVMALDMFARQSIDGVDDFLERYVAFRADIKAFH